VVALAALAAVLLIPVVADRLQHAPPPLAGFLVAVFAAPVVLTIDRIHKALRAGRRRPPIAVA